jgi:hypothetical protein
LFVVKKSGKSQLSANMGIGTGHCNNSEAFKKERKELPDIELDS